MPRKSTYRACAGSFETGTRAAEAVRSGACLLPDPVNIRYATGARYMEVFHLRNRRAICSGRPKGLAILFEFPGCHHVA
jgi:Xaa-Pro dipeptidase